jgi:hypothetical protein
VATGESALKIDPGIAPVVLKEKKDILRRMLEMEGDAIACHPLYQ